MSSKHPRPALLRLLQFVETHREALVRAADRLAGPAAHRRTLHLIEALGASSPRLPRGLTGELAILHRLLACKGDADPGGPEATRLTLMDPCDPVAEEICLLADGLAECLHDLTVEGPDQAPSPAAAAIARG